MIVSCSPSYTSIIHCFSLLSVDITDPPLSTAALFPEFIVIGFQPELESRLQTFSFSNQYVYVNPGCSIHIVSKKCKILLNYLFYFSLII